MSLTVAIVGRPNVGKSTLYNRLTGRRRALVDDQPGVTRDRREGDAELLGLHFRVFDTAGLEEAAKGSLQARMTSMSEQAIDQADVVLLVLDGRVGLTPTDQHFVSLIRKKHKPTLVLVNKLEGKEGMDTLAEAHGLGFGEAIAISAEHGLGMSELHEALSSCHPARVAGSGVTNSDSAFGSGSPLGGGDDDESYTPPMQIVLVGRPNVGKSTLFNQILNEERTLTGPEAGITRDSIMVDAEFKGRALKLVDTAGLRKRANVNERIEKMATGDTIESLRYAHVVVWVVDANQPLEKQDNQIAALVEREGRALVLAVNKWDTIKDKDAYLKAIEQRLGAVMHQLSGLAVVPISAKTGAGVPKLLEACFTTYDIWNKKIGTGQLNRWLEAMLERHAPPLVNKRRIKIRYMTQKTARPPTFILFANIKDIPDHYLRYLIKDLRETFKLPGVPIRLQIRTGKNPYDTRKPS